MANVPAIEIRDLHKQFGSLKVLKGISLTACQGDIVAIIGGSGSGKSTLLRCINLLERPTSGEIAIQGEPYRMKDARHGGLEIADRRQVQRIRAHLGMVFQNFNLWPHRTVLENVIEVPIHVLGMKRDEAIHRAEELLNRVGLGSKKDIYPAVMSGGQQQRAAIARVLAVDPLAMLFVTHEMAFARDVATHVVFLREGIIEEQGPPDQIFGDPRSPHLKQFISSVA